MGKKVLHRLIIALGKLSQREDVEIEIHQSFEQGLSENWKEMLPPDMFEFYQELNGFYFKWKLKNSDELHGIEFLTLENSGKKTINPRTRSYSIPPFQTTDKTARELPLLTAEGTPWKDKGQALFFEGSPDAAGTLLIKSSEGNFEFYDWCNDGEVVKLEGTFSQIIDNFIDNGCTGTLRGPTRDSEIIQKIKKPAKLYSPYEVSVEEIKPYLLRDLWILRGGTLGYKSFDEIMKAFGRKEKAGKLKQPMGEIIAEVLTNNEITEEQAKLLMRSHGKSYTGMDSFDDFFMRNMNEELVCINIGVKYKKAKGLPDPKQYSGWKDLTTMVRAVGGVEELSALVKDSSVCRDLLPYVEIKGAIEPYLACTGNETNNRSMKRVFSLVFKKSASEGIISGSTYPSTAPVLVPILKHTPQRVV